MGRLIKNGVIYGAVGGDNSKTISYQEYLNLPEEEKMNGTTYYIPDANIGGGGSTGTTVEVVDNLDSTDIDKALSANMGRQLKEDMGGLRFGKDGDGNYGYYGADGSLIPFNNKQIYIYLNEHSGESSSSAGTFSLIKYKLNNDLSLTQVAAQGWYNAPQIDGCLYIKYEYPYMSLILKKGYTCLLSGVIYTATDEDVTLIKEQFSVGRGSNPIATIIAFE